MFTYALISLFFVAEKKEREAEQELSKATFLSQLVFKGNYDDLQQEIKKA